MLAFVVALSAASVLVLRVRRRRRVDAAALAVGTVPASGAPPPLLAGAEAGAEASAEGAAERLKRFGLFWYDYLVGDDWQVALGVVLALVLTFVLAPIWPWRGSSCPWPCCC